MIPSKFHGSGGLELVKPAHKPASSRPRAPCIPEKRPRSLARSPLYVDPRRKKTDLGPRSVFLPEISRFALSILAHKGSALPWLVDNRAALRPRRVWCKLTRYSVPRFACACCCAPPGFPRQCLLPLAYNHLPKGIKLELGRGVLGEHCKN